MESKDDDGLALAIEAARLMGWQWRLSGKVEGCRVLAPPNTPDGNKMMGVNYPAYSLNVVFPLANGDEELCADWDRYMPRPDTDPGSALSLLEYVLSQEYHGEIIEVCDMGKGQDAWMVELLPLGFAGVSWTGEALTLSEAILRACVAALRALAGEQQEAGA